jgi:hypothetical protein
MAPRIERSTCKLLGAHQVGQCEVLKEDLHELLLAEMEDEIVLTLAGVACLAAATRVATALRPLDAVAAHVLAIARMHDFAHAPLPVVEDRLGDVLARDVDVLAALHVADAATVDRAPHRLADLVFVAPQEALAVADRLVLARQPPVNDGLNHPPSVFKRLSCSCARAGTTRTAAEPV